MMGCHMDEASRKQRIYRALNEMPRDELEAFVVWLDKFVSSYRVATPAALQTSVALHVPPEWKETRSEPRGAGL
jgi:hypothetical protein